MTTPIVAQKAPYSHEVAAGKTYYWCACGRSANQPFCDGSHKGSAFTPMQWSATESKRVAFCTCKQTETQPLCNGAHKAIAAL